MTRNVPNSQRKSVLTVAIAVLVVVSAGAAVTFTASAAGSTTISLSPDEQQVDTGETTTYEVVVENTDNGIGTTDANVTLTTPSVGEITDLTIAGEPANKNIEITDGGASVSFDAIYFGNALADDPDGVTIATVTVEGTGAGSSDLSLDVTEISDSSGEVYDVTGTEGASLAVGEQTTTTTTETTTATPTETATQTQTATTTETLTPTTTATETPTTTETTTTPSTPTETETTPTTATTQTETATATETTTTTDTTTTPGAATETTTTTDESEGMFDERSITGSLSDSDLTDEQVESIGAALAGSGLSDEQITTITDALAGEDLTDEQRRAIADAVASSDLPDQQLRSLADALNDGRLTDAERETLDFLADDGVAYYQVDFVVGEPIENLRGPNGTYENDQLLRFAHGSTDDPIMRRSEGEFITDEEMADRVESHNITVANGTARTTFSVAEGESVTLTLASYEKVGPGWSPTTEAQQEFVDSETRTFEAGTHTLSVDLPDEERNTSD
jgi:hypothetical protein